MCNVCMLLGANEWEFRWAMFLSVYVYIFPRWSSECFILVLMCSGWRGGCGEKKIATRECHSCNVWLNSWKMCSFLCVSCIIQINKDDSSWLHGVANTFYAGYITDDCKLWYKKDTKDKIKGKFTWLLLVININGNFIHIKNKVYLLATTKIKLDLPILTRLSPWQHKIQTYNAYIMTAFYVLLKRVVLAWNPFKYID